MNISLSSFAPDKSVSRDGFGSPVPRQPARLHIQAECGADLRNSSRFPRRRPFIYFKPSYAIGSVFVLKNGNARTGERGEAGGEADIMVLGVHGRDLLNENGKLLLGCAEDNKLAFVNAFIAPPKWCVFHLPSAYRLF